MHKIIFNCTTNIQGGPVQNAANFIISTLNEKKYKFYYFVSESVFKLIAGKLNMEVVHVFKYSPSKSLRTRYEIKAKANKIEPDLIFTMAGPAYVSFDQMHFMGCSNPYILYANYRDIMFGRSYLSSIIRYFHTKYQKYYIYKADFFLFQTENSKKVFLRNKDINKGVVVPNSIGLIFQESILGENQTRDECLKILCPFELYPHKGAHLIPEIARALHSKNFIFKFIVTIEKNLISDLESKHQDINFIGRQDYFSMAKLYESCDIVFMPSVLEVFSSVTIESLFFQKPLVIADRSFNREIAKEYAFYCNPYIIDSCVDAIISAKEAIHNKDFLKEGKDRAIENFGVYHNRKELILREIDKILLDGSLA